MASQGAFRQVGLPRVVGGDLAPIWPRNAQPVEIESPSRVSWVALAFNADGWYLRPQQFGFDALPEWISVRGTVNGYLKFFEARV